MEAILKKPKAFYQTTTFWIFFAMIIGVLLGGLFPSDQYPTMYELFKFLAKAFISLIKGLIIPLLVSTIIVGVAQTGDVKALGRMGAKALIYFEVVTTLALFIGLFIANWIKPGENLPLDLSQQSGLVKANIQSGWEIAQHVFPSNFFKHAADGDILPVVIFATLFGIALTQLGERGKPVFNFFDSLAQVMFKYTDLIMKITPFGVFGAIAYNVSHMAAGQTINGVFITGWPAVAHLLKQYAILIGSLYFALAVLVVLVFIPVLLVCGVRVWGFFKALKDPALTAFSTASSEAALPKLFEEVVRFGVPKQIAGFVIPTGYSFNLDGSTLYLVLASVTINQAAHAANPTQYPLMSLWTQIVMLLTFMLTSKGVAGVPRATLVIIVGTASNFGLPAEAGVAMLLAVDSVMDMARTTVNVLGNGLASVVVACWEKSFPVHVKSDILEEEEA